jgi:glycine cleavage system H protein
MMHPDDLKYHKEHTWARVEGRRATVGITDYAQESLGDIVYLDLPEVDSTAEANTEISEIESTKATSSVVSPVSGTIVEVNEELVETPEVINEDPYGRGWIMVIELSDPSEPDELMDSSDYAKYVDDESK